MLKLYRKLRYQEREFRSRLLKALGMRHLLWKHGLFDELQYWERTIAGVHRDKFYGERLDAQLPLQGHFRELIKTSPEGKVLILDVGAGPLTSLGKTWGDQQLEIIAVDPLAEKFDAILEHFNILPPVRTIAACAERLNEKFSPNTFDFVHARNSLDHCEDAIAAIEQMVQVAKPGACVYLWHRANVGEIEFYRGLHQWNFDIVGGELMVGNGRVMTKIAERVEAHVTCEWDREHVVAVLKKW